MFLATSNKAKRLLHLSYIGQVRPEEIRSGNDDLKILLTDLPPGFRLLADFGRLESMDLACTTEIGRVMEWIDQRGVSLVVRVIPDASKDIGMDILALFHYRHHPKVVSCENIVEAGKQLSL